jgi:DNA-binding IclR family transcriptional regulator
VCIDRTLSKSRVQVLGFDIGERRPLGIGAAGQALLSFLPEKEREVIMVANGPRYMKYYGVEVDVIRGWIRNTRKLQYSNSIHIVTPESIGVGVPVFDRSNHVVAAISMASITERMTPERCEEVAGIMLSEIAAVEPPAG